MVNNITLLDCTLRDGAHLNKGNFGKNTIIETITDLVESDIDIVEIGFFDNELHNEDSTFFSSIADVKRILPKNKGNVKYSLMADFVDVSQVEPYDGTIDFFRLSFKRHRLEWGLNAARILMEKGYKCFINPVNCNVYSDQEYLEVIRRVNELKPFGFSIVDTFGVFRKQNLSRIYYLLEGNLDPDITIGLHLHENLGLSYSLAQHFIEIRDPKRKINIDCSLFGMGRAPGNLCTEQIMDHLNIYQGAKYNTEPALDAIDDYIAPLKRKYEWGYSIPYALSGKYGLHRTYAEYLLGKNRLKTKDIQRILRMVDKDHIEMFDENYIDGLYRQYTNVDYNDSNSIQQLTEELAGKSVVIICPGSSIIKFHDQIKERITQPDTKVISVNFLPANVDPDFVFCANKKRISNISGSNCSKIVTSNIADEIDNKGYVFSFNESVYFNEVFCEDSTLMLLKILKRCGCYRIELAGFDGFQDKKQNYYSNNYTNEIGKNVSSKTVKAILKTAFEDLQLEFLTPSIYQ